MKLAYDEKALERHIDRVIQKTLDMDLIWDWPCGVAYYGVVRAWEATGRAEYLDRLRARVDELIALRLPAWSVNACAMGHCLLTLYAETGAETYLDILRGKLDYLQHKAPRFGDGVLQHTVSSRNDFPEQAWADTLFMAGYFMLRAGVLLEDAGLVADALNQFYWHIEYLQNKATGLWYHAYNHIEKGHMSGFSWARANAWAAYTMSRVRTVLPQPYLYPAYMHVDCSLRDQLTALKKLEREDGLWGTILDDEESYGEVSASAGIAAAMVLNRNPLHTCYAQRALDGVLANISEDGRVLNVSGGTAVMRDREGYRKVPKDWIQGWGQGLTLTLLAAVLGDKSADDAAR
jgi:unsaturated rhamnogalacturonyl hydrolase